MFTEVLIPVWNGSMERAGTATLALSSYVGPSTLGSLNTTFPEVWEPGDGAEIEKGMGQEKAAQIRKLMAEGHSELDVRRALRVNRKMVAKAMRGGEEA